MVMRFRTTTDQAEQLLQRVETMGEPETEPSTHVVSFASEQEAVLQARRERWMGLVGTNDSNGEDEQEAQAPPEGAAPEPQVQLEGAAIPNDGEEDAEPGPEAEAEPSPSEAP